MGSDDRIVLSIKFQYISTKNITCKNAQQLTQQLKKNCKIEYWRLLQLKNHIEILRRLIRVTID